MYKCVKCDDKRMICYGCMITCHKGHPVVYSTELKQPKCSCKDISGDKCTLFKQNDLVRGGPKEHSLGANQMAYGIEKRVIRRNEYGFGDEGERYDMMPNLQVYDDEEFIN
jgi:hypothetical protein